MRISGIEVKVFLVGYLVSVVAFLLVFGVVWAVVYEHRLLSERLTGTFLVNFFYSMIFYFFLTTVYSVLAYRVPTWRSVKIFILAYGISMITLYVGSILHSLYWGNPLTLILFQGDPISQFFYLLFLGLLSLPPAISTVLLYGVYRLTRSR